jgi:hypothetical protein
MNIASKHLPALKGWTWTCDSGENINTFYATHEEHGDLSISCDNADILSGYDAIELLIKKMILMDVHGKASQEESNKNLSWDMEYPIPDEHETMGPDPTKPLYYFPYETPTGYKPADPWTRWETTKVSLILGVCIWICVMGCISVTEQIIGWFQ